MKRLLLMGLLAVAAASAIEPAGDSLLTVKRVFVESLGATLQATLLHDMIAASLAQSGLFTVTENADHADAILRGSGDDEIFNEQHHLTDTLSAGLHNASAQDQSSRYTKTGSSKSGGLSISQNESSNIDERKHEASVSVRLVNRDGDVIWSTTQESNGAKFKSASADVADKILRKLMDDVQRARANPSAATHAGMPTK